MHKAKKIFTLLLLMLLVILNTACVFPDKLPELKQLKNYSPMKVTYGKTTLEQFKKLFPKIPDSDIEVYTDGITIVKVKPATPDVYSFIRVGFKDNKLDWIEFNLAHKMDVSKFVALYGSPAYIEARYNKDLDYYNYEFFNISADKVKRTAAAITYFDKSPIDEVSNTPKKADIPANKSKRFFEKFSNIEPGTTTESDFSKEYPEMIPYTDDKSETSSIYVMTDELGEAGYYYDKAVLKFESGLLTWINLIPKNLPLKDCLKNIKYTYKKENVDSTYDIYDFSNFIIITDKKTKTVKSIGLFNKDIKL